MINYPPYRAYIITFNRKLFESLDYSKFHTDLTTASAIIDWWHFLENAYIVIVESRFTATDINNYLMQIAPNKNFFVCQLNLSDHNGWLPPQAWDWVNRYINNT